MYKLLIVDDEINIRKGIINAIRWETLGLEPAGEAGDGGEALDRIRKLTPDIVLMDMRMPGIDGVGLIHSLKEQYPAIRFIIISAYSDFDYTREAIVNKAFDYLLKPIKEDELNRILANCIEELDKERIADTSRNNSIHNADTPENILSELILKTDAEAGIDRELAEIARKMLNFPRVYCCVFKIDDIYKARQTADQNDLLNQLEADIEELLHNQLKAFAFANRQDNEIISVLSERSEKCAAILQNTADRFHRLRNFSVSAGLGSAAGTPEELHMSYMQARRAVTMKSIRSCGQVILHESLKNDGTAESEAPFYSGELILNTIKAGNSEKSCSLLDRFIEDMAAGNTTVHTVQKNMIILLGDIDKELYANGTSIDVECGRSSIRIANHVTAAFSAGEIADVIRPVITKLSLYFRMKNKKGGKKIVDEIVKNVQNEYSRPISLYSYAKQYYLNPDYLGRVFKNETGKSFADYLTEIRIGKAKELIRNEMCSHYYEVASSVGYDDYSYFCKVFRAITGQTPGEYKDYPGTPNGR